MSSFTSAKDFFVSNGQSKSCPQAKALPAKRSEKGYGDENGIADASDAIYLCRPNVTSQKGLWRERALSRVVHLAPNVHASH